MSSIPKLDLIGKRFGRLTAISRAVDGKWLCLCDCGTEHVVPRCSLVSGGTKSCGCLRHEVVSSRQKTHGLSGTPEYTQWTAMKSRCLSKNNQDYSKYGGRGIKVFEGWVKDFAAFFTHMGPKPHPKSKIERINNDGNYEPGNVRWASRKEQNRNSSNNRLITFKGKIQCVSAWAEEIGIRYMTLISRLNRGMPVEYALKAQKYPRRITHVK